MKADDIATKDDLFELERRLLEKLGELKQDASMHLKWLRSAQVREMLSISPGTLQNLRINGHLPYSRIGTILYYRYEDVLAVLTKNLVKP
jgi:hypothetical protein